MRQKITFLITGLLLIAGTSYGQNDQLTPEERAAFKQRAIEKTQALGNYIKTIVDNSITDVALKNNTIDVAVKLFVDETKKVYVRRSSGKVNKYPIRGYLLSLLSKAEKVERVEIKWYDIAYIKDLYLGDDGNYYGTISLFQKFKGFDSEGNVVFEEVAEQSVSVVIKKIVKRIGDKEIKKWSVLLGDINVTEVG